MLALTSELWDVYDENSNKTGRLHERGKDMRQGEYHLVVHVWIMNDKGEFLISKRAPGIPSPNIWQCTGGSAVAGDDSLTTALKESREELGIILVPENGLLFKRYKRHLNGLFISGDIIDVWLFRQDMDISAVALQPTETCGAMWASKGEICRMINEGTFLGREIFPYIDELFGM